MTDVQLLALTRIDLDEDSWPRTALQEERVQDFARAYIDDGPFSLDPITVTPRGQNRYLLVNGRHRLAARRLIGADDVPAVSIDTHGVDPVEFAYEFALADAARSALPLTRAEKHSAVVRLLERHPERTDVAIASLAGVSSKTVQRARKWLADNSTYADQSSQEPDKRWRPTTSADVAKTLARQIDRLWSHRPAGMAMGFTDSAKLGDLIAEAFIERVGIDEAVVHLERLTTWSQRAYSVARATASEQA